MAWWDFFKPKNCGHEETIKELNQFIASLSKDLNEANSKTAMAMYERDDLLEKVKLFKQELDSLKESLPVKVEKNPNNAKPSLQGFQEQRVEYAGRPYEKDKEFILDVRDFFLKEPNPLALTGLITQERFNEGSFDERVEKITQWVYDNVKYVYDRKQNGFEEYWQFPSETLKSLCGDCEDQALLIIGLALKASVPSERLLVCGGWAFNPYDADDKDKTGHAWPIYQTESGKWRSLDTAFFKTKTVYDKPLLDEDQRYQFPKEVWFVFNDSFTAKPLKGAKKTDAGLEYSVMHKVRILP